MRRVSKSPPRYDARAAETPALVYVNLTLRGEDQRALQVASFFAETEAEFDELMREVLDGLSEQAQKAAVDPK